MTNPKPRLLPDLPLAIVAALMLCLGGLAMPAMAGHYQADPRQLDRFMWGLAGEESGWNYYVVNPHGGAFGRYQMMPANWRGWSRQYLGRGWHDPSPLNQELVARAKVSALYAWLGDWNRVAYWWPTGSSDPDQTRWTPGGKRYVSNVMSLMARAPKKPSTLPSDPAQATGLAVNPGDWRVAGQVSRLRTAPAGDRIAVGRISVAETLLVQRSQLGPKGEVLWLRVKAADGAVGWVDARRTLPAATLIGGSSKAH